MQIADFFDPVSIQKLPFTIGEEEVSFSRQIDIHTVHNRQIDITQYKIAIVGVPENRNTINKDTCHAPDRVRQYLYQFSMCREQMKIVDLGNLIIPDTIEGTYAALREVMIELLQTNVLPVIIGGGQHLEYAVFKAYQFIGKRINICSIDSKIDSIHDKGEINSDNYIQRIIQERDKNLFHYTVIGCQSYFISPTANQIFDREMFDVIRIGELREEIRKTEPVIRDANMVGIDMSAVRYADSPGSKNAMANGFYGEEITRLAHYAGRSESVSSFGIYEINPEDDTRGITTSLAAQILWYYIEGVSARVIEDINAKHVKKIIVALESIINQKITFYKSNLTERWWMEIPSEKYNNAVIIACSEEDYNTACRDEIPKRWWLFYKKIN